MGRYKTIINTTCNYFCVLHDNFKKATLGSFFRSTHPSHDDYEKTIGNIDKRFFAFNCQLKKLNGEIFIFFSDYRFIRNSRSQPEITGFSSITHVNTFLVNQIFDM